MSVAGAPVRVLIADDHTLFRAGLAKMLAEDKRLDIVGEAKDGAEAFDQTMQRQPDVVLMDLQMPRVTGVEALRQISAGAPDVSVIVLSAYADANTIGEVIAGGAKGVVNKDVTAAEMVERILEVSSGKPKATRRTALLSTREVNVLKQVAVGRSNKQIAQQLGISQKTVRNHLSRIFGKLSAGNRTEAVMNAMRLGVLSI